MLTVLTFCHFDAHLTELYISINCFDYLSVGVICLFLHIKKSNYLHIIIKLIGNYCRPTFLNSFFTVKINSASKDNITF